MQCHRCPQPAVYTVRRTKADPGEHVCDDCLPAAWKAAGVPRETTLLDPRAAAKPATVQPALF